MGWFSKLFGRKSNDSAMADVSIGLEELSAAINKKLDASMEQFAPELENFYSQIKSSADNMQEKVKMLGKAVPAERVDFQLLKVAASNRDEAVRRMNVMLKEFRQRMPEDLDSFIRFHESCLILLNDTNGKLARHYGFFGEVFKHESSMMASGYKNMHRLLANIGENLRSKKHAVAPLLEIKSYVESVENLLADISLNNQNIANLNSELEASKNKLDSLKNEVSNLASGTEWASFQSMMKDMELVDKEMKDAEGYIIQAVASIDRELKKYNHLQDSYGKPLLEFYLENPVAASLSDKNQEGMKDIMKRVEAAILEKKIVVDGKKEGRILEKLREMRSGSLEFMVKRYEVLKDKKLELDGRLKEGKIKDVKYALESELDKTGNDIKELEDRLLKLRGINKQKYDEIIKVKGVLEMSVKAVLNQDVTIIVPDIGV